MIERTFDAQLAQGPFRGVFGPGWIMNYETRIFEESDGTVKLVIPNGKMQFYKPNGDGTYAPTLPGNYAELTKDSDEWWLVLKDGSIYKYDTIGRLDYLEDTKDL